MASTRSAKRSLSLLVAGLVAMGFGCDDDHAADHAGDHGDHEHAGSDAHSHAGAGGAHDHSSSLEMPIGPLTGATCPSTGSTLTYENFAKQFIADYCLGCHSEKLTGPARMGAPEDHSFDTYADVDLMHKHIDQLAGSGPDSTNTRMPPPTAPKKPSLEERQKLSEWIACGNPEK